MCYIGNAFVRGNVRDDIPGNEPNHCFLVKVEFINDLGKVVKGPFFGVSGDGGDFLIFTDPISRLEAELFSLKISYRYGYVTPARHFTSTQGMDPENYL